MTDYRRYFVPGGSYFFTVNLADRSQRLLVEHINLLRRAMSETRSEYSFIIDAMVVLPDHLHAIWTLPTGDANYSRRWQTLKTRFSRGLPKTEPRSESRLSKGERGIWQRRFWEHLIRDENDWRHHMDYIHYNPVKHGHVEKVLDWAF
jgi:putative transposase